MAMVKWYVLSFPEATVCLTFERNGPSQGKLNLLLMALIRSWVIQVNGTFCKVTG